nr:hypothetical protein [Candidatus Freyarchaeota archaeon]
MPLEIKPPIGYLKRVEVLEKKDFPICVTKEKEVGLVRKRIWYIHRSKDRWSVLQLEPELSHYTFLDQSKPKRKKAR